MIQISVKSEIYNDKRQFETQEKALCFLKLIAKIHLLSRLQSVGKKPKALNICGRALDTNNILPINSSYLFGLTPNKLEISACNMMTSISTSLNLMGSDLEFKISIPGNRLRDYISKSKPELLVFTIEEHITPPTETTDQQISYSVTIASSSNPKNKCNMPCEPGEHFPVIKNTATTELTLPAEDLIEVLFKTMFAIADNDLRPASNGLNVNIKDGKLTCTSLNFKLMASYSYDVPNLPNIEIIIPKKSLQLIQSLSPTGELKIGIGDAISIDFNGISTRSRLIDERYPDFKSVIPADNDIEFVTSRTELISSLKRIMPFCGIIKMIKLNISGVAVELIAENIDFAEQAKEEIAGALIGSEILIGADGECLMDLLNSFTENETWFCFSEPNKAMIITDGAKHVNPGRENLVLLMPLFI